MKKTDWDSYYLKPSKIAFFTRNITKNKIIKAIKSYILPSLQNNKNIKIAEFGGANSAFFTEVNDLIKPQQYHVIDNNKAGLELLRKKTSNQKNPKIILENKDILKNFNAKEEFNFVYSIGLIEHFNKAQTAKCLIAHFDALENNHYCLITYPTPTMLYKITRKILEIFNLWIFHDERPLTKKEIFPLLKNHGVIIHHEIIWAIFLTQQLVVIKKQNKHERSKTTAINR